MKPAFFAAAAFSVVLAGCGGGGPDYVVTDDVEGRMTLSARHSVAAPPDRVRISTSVIGEGETAAGALADQRNRMNAVRDAITEAGVADTNVQTSNFDLAPVYAPFDRATQDRAIIGYQASNRVTLVSEDLDGFGAALDALVDAGADTLSGVRFEVSDAETYLDEARQAATADVFSRAALYADAGGFTLGRLLELREGGAQPIASGRTFAREATIAEATPIDPGELDLSVTVTATFEILNSRRR